MILGAATMTFIHKLQKGILLWVPLKRFEKKTRKQLQEEAYESKKRNLAVLEANDYVLSLFFSTLKFLQFWSSVNRVCMSVAAFSLLIVVVIILS